MGAAIWRRSEEHGPERDPPSLLSRRPGVRFRIEVFGTARAPSRDTPAEAMGDAIRLGLVS